MASLIRSNLQNPMELSAVKHELCVFLNFDSWSLLSMWLLFLTKRSFPTIPFLSETREEAVGGRVYLSQETASLPFIIL